MAFFLCPGYFDDDGGDDDDWLLDYPPPVDEEYVKKATAEVLDDETPITVTMTIRQAWLLLCAGQLVTRQDTLHAPIKELTEEIARQLQGEIVKAHPNAAELIEMGWDEDYDQ